MTDKKNTPAAAPGLAWLVAGVVLTVLCAGLYYALREAGDVRSGPVVTLHAALLKSADATTTGRTVATLPAGFRPPRPIYFQTYWGRRGYINTGGHVSEPT